MPGGDGTGPGGVGPMTGRAAGFCAGYGAPGFANPVFGRGLGLGWGRGGGCGRRNRFYTTGMAGWRRAAIWPWTAAAPAYAGPLPAMATREQQIDSLKGQAEYFEEALEEIRQRIEELETKTREP